MNLLDIDLEEEARLGKVIDLSAPAKDEDDNELEDDDLDEEE